MPSPQKPVANFVNHRCMPRGQLLKALCWRSRRRSAPDPLGPDLEPEVQVKNLYSFGCESATFGTRTSIAAFFPGSSYFQARTLFRPPYLRTRDLLLFLNSTDVSPLSSSAPRCSSRCSRRTLGNGPVRLSSVASSRRLRSPRRFFFLYSAAYPRSNRSPASYICGKLPLTLC